MKKNKLYRVGAGLLAGLLVFTGVPQTYSFAEETKKADDNTAAYIEMQTDASLIGEDSQEDSIIPSAVLPDNAELTNTSEQLSADPTIEDINPQTDESQTVDLQDGEGEAEKRPVTAITLRNDKLTPTRNETVKLEYDLVPADANEGTEVTFTSSDEKIAKVNENGMILAVATGGPVFITARTANGKTATCEVTVRPIMVDSVTISPEDTLKLMENGKNGTLTVSVLPEDADELGITVTSDNEKVATVTSAPVTGTNRHVLTVTPVSGGVALIKVVSLDKNNKKAFAVRRVEVEAAPVEVTGIKPKNAKISMYQNQTVTLGVLYEPAHTTQTGVTWKIVSGNKWDYNGDGEEEECVTVDEKGLVRCLYSLPANVSTKEVKIQATSTEKTLPAAEFTVTIKKPNIPATSLAVLTKDLTLEDSGRNQAKTVEVRVDPATTTDIPITAESDDETVAVVTKSAAIDATGIARFTVTGIKPGSCEISFKAGKVETTLPVTVIEYVAPVDNLLLGSSLEITELQEKTLEAEIKPLEAENRYIDWSISDPEIATIKSLGTDGRTTAEKTGQAGSEKLTSAVTIVAHMVGECELTATAAGGISKTCKIKVVSDSSKAVTSLNIATDEEGIGSNPERIYIRQGQSITFKPTVAPTGANKKVRWSSGGSDVVSLSVDNDSDSDNYSACTIKADHTGICTVTAQASSDAPECKKQIEIHVVKPRLEVVSPEDFSFTPDQMPIEKTMITDQLKVYLYKYAKVSLTDDATELNADEYSLGIVAENGMGVRPYAPEDMEKVGTKMLVITCPYDGETIEYPERVLVEMKKFSEAELVSITPLSGNEAEVWNVPNGTPASSLPLAKTVEITIKGVKSGKIVKADADIQWNLNAIGYNVDSAEAQEFVVYGTVELPEYVKNVDKISLDISVKVHVREAATSGKQVEAPKFSVMGGEKIGNTAVEVPYGSKIVIESNTENAVIYYMMNQRPDTDRGVPQDEEHRYKSPIEITEKTTTIYAIATREGYKNSDCSECTVKLVKAEIDVPDDPDDPEPDQVVDTDRPETGKVPSGLWVAVQPDENGRKDDFPYTGSAIKPVIRVYSHTTLLTEKKDYTISYKNNTKAGEKGSENAPCIIVKGKGNYSGEAKLSFTIKPQDIEDDSIVMEEYVAAAYNKKEQKPNPSIYWNGKKLTKGKDFTVTDRVYKDPKVYNVTVTGIGNFTGTRKMTYEIFNGGVSVSKLKVSKIADQKCTGAAITPSVVVKYKNTVLRENANYSVQYVNNIEVGTASVIITGRGNYKGTKCVNFKIKAMAKISDASFEMTFDPATPVYNGVPVKPVSYSVKYQGKDLKEGVDYKVSYANNNMAGTASLILTGIGRFNGTAKKNYKIKSGDLNKMIVELAAEYRYEKGGCKPKPTVISGNYILKEGKDYTLSYSNHKAVGNNASVTVKGKGSFKGTIIKKFAVTRQDIANLQIVAADKTYRNKSNSYRTSVKVIDVNGKVLAAGKDYDKEMYYTYADGSKQGEQVMPTDLIPMGTNLRVEVRVSKPKNYVGTAYSIYRIIQADISKAKVKVNPQEYTGRKIKPGKDQIHVTLDDVILGSSDYEIVEYQNNVNQGTAKVTIRGVGSYGGTKTASFKIRKRGLTGLTF